MISLTKSPGKSLGDLFSAGDHQILQDDEDIPWWGTGVPVRHWQSWQGFKLRVQDGDLCAVKIGQLSWDPAANDGKSGWVRIAYSSLFVYHPETSTKKISKPDQFIKIKILMRIDHSTLFSMPKSMPFRLMKHTEHVHIPDATLQCRFGEVFGWRASPGSR